MIKTSTTTMFPRWKIFLIIGLIGYLFLAVQLTIRSGLDNYYRRSLQHQQIQREQFKSASVSRQASKRQEHREESLGSNHDVRILAIVFPQFHRDPLNDKLWGDGFTDWDNLRKAPLQNRLGFDIPRPLDIEKGGLGMYDYTAYAPRKRQSELAKQYGIHGFVFHHYWFYDPDHPGPTLNAPLDAMLRDGQPDHPFCLHWCASKWQNTWMASQMREGYTIPKNGELQHQYFPKDNVTAIREHYQWLRQFFHHPNYIKVQGQPVFMVYQKKVGSFPVLKILRQLAIEDGFPSLFVTVGLGRPHPHLSPEEVLRNETATFTRLNRVPFDLFNKTTNYPNPNEWNERKALVIPKNCPTQNSVGSREESLKRTVEIPGILTSFDNTPRRTLEEAYLWSSDRPDVVVERFRQSLTNALWYESCCFPTSSTSLIPNPNRKGSRGWLKQKEEYAAMEDDARFILINSMNEWAEGMALEPSDVFQFSMLEAVRDSQKLIQNCRLPPDQL